MESILIVALEFGCLVLAVFGGEVRAMVVSVLICSLEVQRVGASVLVRFLLIQIDVFAVILGVLVLQDGRRPVKVQDRGCWGHA